jgi:molybdate transport system substrate-binding protein
LQGQGVDFGRICSTLTHVISFRIREPRPALRAAALAASLALLVPLAACGSRTGGRAGDGPGPAATASSEPAPSSSPSATATSGSGGELTVFAAASLTEAFTELGKAFEAKHPGVGIKFQFGSSATLATQITNGAPADVFAAASPATMKTVTDAGDAQGTPVVFVKNRLEIATPKDNPGDVAGLADFTKKDLAIVLCAATVPCGTAADKVFTAAGITPEVDSREPDVKAVLTKVRLGEADAGLVYRTDVLAAGDEVKGIEFPEAEKAINDYPIVALKDSKNADTARDWVEFIGSDEARKVLQDAGFEAA